VSEAFLLGYGFLGLFTAAMAALAVVNWRRNGGAEQLIMPAMLYYYSLFGAWQILASKRSAQVSEALLHLESSLVTVRVDDHYLYALVLYGLFNLVFLAGIGLASAAIPSTRRLAAGSGGAYTPSGRRLALLSVLALGGSAASLWTEILTALDQGASLYLLTRKEVSAWFTVHQLLNRVGLAALACAWPLHLREGGLLRPRPLMGLSLLGVSAAWMGYLGLLGNRNEIVVAVLGALYFYLCIGGQLRWPRLVGMGFLAYVGLRSIEYLRAVPFTDLAEAFMTALADPRFWDPTTVAGGSESLAAHISLYGVLARNLDFTWGSSFIYLLQSLVPLLPASARVPDSYQVYAAAVGAPEGQGFNIHFVAAAYLNGGLLAILLATLALVALFWVVRKVTWQYCAARPALALPAIFGYALFCALVPISMRSGPENFKALVFEGFAIPFLVAWAAVPRRRVAQTAPPAIGTT